MLITQKFPNGKVSSVLPIPKKNRILLIALFRRLRIPLMKPKQLS